MNEFESLLALFHTKGVGPKRIQKWVKEYGSLFEACKAKSITFSKEAQEDLRLAEKSHVNIIPYFSHEYPQELFLLEDFPPLLYTLGSFPKERKIGIVGTRNATHYGLEMAKQIARDLSSQKMAIVSGLARGIDTMAHEGALLEGKTIAFIGSGLANIYPRENISLAREIERNGILASEFAMNTPPYKENFPKRNRLVSAISESLVLIEAPLKSGAMITMNLALEQNKQTFVLPGRVDCPNFEGNLHLLSKNQAKVARNAEDILGFSIQKNILPSNPVQLSKDEELIIKFFPKHEISIEEIGIKSKLPMSKINFTILGLVLKKVVREYPGKMYKLCEKYDG